MNPVLPVFEVCVLHKMDLLIFKENNSNSEESKTGQSRGKYKEKTRDENSGLEELKALPKGSSYSVQRRTTKKREGFFDAWEKSGAWLG